MTKPNTVVAMVECLDKIRELNGQKKQLVDKISFGDSYNGVFETADIISELNRVVYECVEAEETVSIINENLNKVLAIIEEKNQKIHENNTIIRNKIRAEEERLEEMTKDHPARRISAKICIDTSDMSDDEIKVIKEAYKSLPIIYVESNELRDYAYFDKLEEPNMRKAIFNAISEVVKKLAIVTSFNFENHIQVENIVIYNDKIVEIIKKENN